MPKLHIDNEDKLNLLPETFYITYYAKKHSKIITRKGLKFKPNTQTQGRYQESADGTPRFWYWDCNAPANENGNQWRQATGLITVEDA
tara:strand:- start:241 stop:504 length:264 start_codon:yes stop_codon:yes gene_type:complete